jgi:hypothetical protein
VRYTDPWLAVCVEVKSCERRVRNCAPSNQYETMTMRGDENDVLGEERVAYVVIA